MTAASYLFDELIKENAPLLLWGGLLLIFSTFLLDVRDHFKKRKTSNLLLMPPKHRYSLVWDKHHDLQIIIRPILLKDEKEPNTRLPIFRLKNLSTNVIKDISIKWNLPEEFLNEEVMSSKIFDGLELSQANNILFFTKKEHDGQKQSGSAVSLKETQNIQFLQPHINNEDYTDIVMPYAISASIEAVIISKFDENPPIGSTHTVFFFVEISYKENETTFKDKYTVNCTARSSKPQSNGIIKIPINGKMREPPLVMADLKFEVKNDQ